MKKKMLLIGAIVATLVIAAVFFLNRGGDVRDVVRIPAESTLYSEEEIEEAMNIAIKAFEKEFEGCKLLTIAYDEADTKKEISNAGGDIRLLILVSEFYVGDGAEPNFTPNWTYDGWKWIFRNDGDGWKLIGWGWA